jgi:hypothetical protein
LAAPSRPPWSIGTSQLCVFAPRRTHRGDRALLEQPHQARARRPVGAISSPVDAGRHDPMVLRYCGIGALLRAAMAAGASDRGGDDLRMTARTSHLASRRRGRPRLASSKPCASIFWRSAVRIGELAERVQECRLPPLSAAAMGACAAARRQAACRPSRL